MKLTVTLHRPIENSYLNHPVTIDVDPPLSNHRILLQLRGKPGDIVILNYQAYESKFGYWTEITTPAELRVRRARAI